MLPHRWTILFVLVSVKCAHGHRSIIDFLLANSSTEWNEDLEPVVMSFVKRIRKELLPVVQEILYDEEIPIECLQSFARVSSGLSDRQLWALKFLDASGGLVPGQVGFHFASLGNYDECLGIRVPDRDEPEKIAFGGQYCTASLRISRQPLLYRWLPEIAAQERVLVDFLGGANATWALELMEKMPLGYRLGICLPSTCDSSIISHLAEKFGGKYGVKADVLACRDQLHEPPMATGTVIAGMIFATMAGFVILGTIVDSMSGNDSRGCVKVIRCFSARASYLKVSSTEMSSANVHLDCIHGIRVLSSFWILYSHTYGGDPGLYDNGTAFLKTLTNPIFSLVLQGMLAVDTFFTLSGILLYRTLKIERKLNKMPLLLFVLVVIVRRAFRLLIPSIGALCIFYLFPLLTSGPGFDSFYPFFRNNCDQRWWTIPLFINNFWSFEETCLGNQWYNAADMQLLCILIFPVLLMLRKPAKGLLVVLTFIAISIIYTAGLIFVYDATPIVLILPRRVASIIQFSLRVHDQSLPHLASVGVGVIGGYFIENHRNTKFNKVLSRIGWFLFTALILTLIFVIYVWNQRGSITTSEALIYGGFYRPLWAVCIVWLVYMCSSGRAQCIRWILSRPNFIVLSRLSFCFYLMQMPVVMIKNFTARFLVPFTYYQNFRDFFADMAFNYMAASILFVLFEAPAYAIDKLVASGEREKLSHRYSGEKIKCNDSKSDGIPSIQYKL